MRLLFFSQGLIGILEKIKIKKNGIQLNKSSQAFLLIGKFATSLLKIEFLIKLKIINNPAKTNALFQLSLKMIYNFKN